MTVSRNKGERKQRGKKTDCRVKKAVDDVCTGCSRCLVGCNKKESEFSAYKPENIFA